MPRRPRPTTTLNPRSLSPIHAGLRRANAVAARTWPGEPEGRQPVHTVYGGAHLFRADTARRLGSLALAALEEYAPDAGTLAAALQLDRGSDERSARRDDPSRVLAKLRSEPVEDFRIDFEDGYGNRPDAEEDGHAAVRGARGGRRPRGAARCRRSSAFASSRCRRELHARGLRTLDLFVTTLARRGRRAPAAELRRHDPEDPVAGPGRRRGRVRARVIERRLETAAPGASRSS